MKQLDSRHLLAGFATVLSVATVLVIVGGLLHIHMSTGFAVVVLLLSVVSGAVLALRAGPEIFGPRPLAGEPLAENRLYAILGGIGLALYAFIFIPLWSRPDITWDAMAYHMPTIQLWSQRGYVHWIGANEGYDILWWKFFIDPLMNGYPKGAEVLGFLLSNVSGGHLANGWNFFYMPLGILGIYVGAREFDVARAPALFAAALFSIIPVNASQLTCGYVDTGYAACIAGFFALMIVIVRRVLGGARVTWLLVIVAGELLGLALGIKPPATMATVVSAGVLGLVILFAARSQAKGERGRFVLAHSGRLGALLAAALLVGGYWYARNWDYRQNPLFPVEVKVAGHEVFPGTPLDQQITIDGVTPDYIKPWPTALQVAYSWVQSGHLELPPDQLIEHDRRGNAMHVDSVKVRWPAWPRTIRYQDSRIGGLGFAWLGASLPAAIWFLRSLFRAWRKSRSKSDLADLVAFGSVSFTVLLCFLGSPLKWWARYTIWIEVPGFIALGVLLHRLTEPGVAAQHVQQWVRRGAVAISVLTFLEYGYSLKWAASQPYFVGPPQLHATLNPVSILRAVTTTEDNGCGAIFHYLPKGLVHEETGSSSSVLVSPVALHHAPALGQLSSPPGARRWVLAPPAMGTNEALARELIAKHHPRFVVWDPDGVGPAPALEAMAVRKEKAYGLLFLDLTNEPPPAVLLPK